MPQEFRQGKEIYEKHEKIKFLEEENRTSSF